MTQAVSLLNEWGIFRIVAGTDSSESVFFYGKALEKLTSSMYLDYKQFKGCTFLQAHTYGLKKNQKELFLTNIQYSPNPTFFFLSNVPNFNLGFETFVDTYLIDSFDRICLVNKVTIFFEFILLLVAWILNLLNFTYLKFLKLKLNLLTYVMTTGFLR